MILIRLIKLQVYFVFIFLKKVFRFYAYKKDFFRKLIKIKQLRDSATVLHFA